MKRFHVHVGVRDLEQSIRFYSSLFGVDPTVLKDDYAKWMIEDPRINFAISTRGGARGVDHLGIQADSAGELAELNSRADAADMALLEEGEVSCCYARSEKHWVTDPQGIAWEHFHTLDDIPTFSAEPVTKAVGGTACCTGSTQPRPAPAESAPARSCC